MPHSCPRVAHALMSSVWAIHPLKARPLLALAMRAAEGRQISEADREANRVGEGRSGVSTAPKAGVAMVPIVGTIVHRAEQADDISAPGAVSAARLRSVMRGLQTDEDVTAVVLDIESPGGSVDGIEELGAEIARLADIKPVTAVANAYAHSAAYWIASQASEIVITPSGELGSIGVYTLHEDDTEMLKLLGVNMEIIRAGEHKIEANPFEPLSDEARAELRASVERYYDTFTKAVATGRNMSVAELRKAPYGKGRVLGAKDAVKAGLADRVDTLEATVSRLASGKGRTRASRRRSQTLLASFEL